ncbi:MAG: EAL domain-containing protein [Usitatibacteraceae bacterium]
MDATAHGLTRYDILDTPPEAAYNDLVRRAADALGTTMAGMSFFEYHLGAAGVNGPFTREWFKARTGIPFISLTPKDCFYHPALTGSCQRPGIFVIPDLLADKRFRDHALVAGPPHICFYAAAGIFSPVGELLGALSVFDTVSRDIIARETEALKNLAALAQARLEARIEARSERRGAAALTQIPAIVGQRSATTEAELTGLQLALEDEIATRKATEAKLRYEKDFSEAAVSSLPRTFFMFERDGRIVRWNKQFAQSVGHTEADFQAMRALDFIGEADRAMVADAVRRIFENGEEVTLEAHMRRKDGVATPYSIYGRAVDLDGRRYCIGVGRDITDQKRAEREITRAKERLDLALVGSGLAIWDWDLVNNKVFFSENWRSLLGVRPIDDEGIVHESAQVAAWNHPDDQERFHAAVVATAKGLTEDFQCEFRAPGETEEWVWLQSKGKVTQRDAGGRALRMTGTTANIAKRKSAEERVEFLATRDPLTGLPNRMLVNDRLEQGVANAARKNAGLAFMFIDLDRFKTINDSLGHDVGDELLKRVAARLAACVRVSDTVARLGGDEFAVILENLSGSEGNDTHEGAQQVAEKMIAALAAPIMINSHHLTTSCSIGIGIYPTDGLDPKTLMKHADVAMYDAKAKGRNNYQFFSHELNAKAQERLAIENYLRLALRRDELCLYYQPRVSFKTGKVTGVEALIRWQHPRHGLLTPDKFIGVAEDSGLIVPIGEWVFEHAFKQVAEWQKKSGRDIRLAVNMSVGQMFDGNRLLRTLEQSAVACALDLRTVELELTESMLLKNMDDTIVLLRQLGDMGLGLAIDDFGTGYSSLSYLKQLPVDSIKVDSSFVRDIGTDPNDEAIIRAIIAMTHSLKLNVIAEGVENEEQYRVLRDLACDEYQGFFFSKPLPPAEFEAQFLDVD